MAKKKDSVLTPEEAKTLEEVKLPDETTVELSPGIEQYLSDLGDDTPKVQECGMEDDGWTDYVMSNFTEKELVNGKPNIRGLRRVIRVLVGNVIDNEVEVVQAPGPWPGEDRTLTPAVVVYRMTIQKEDGYSISVSDTADSYIGNTDKNFAMYPTAIATTRAEARCLRKALNLSVCSAEELNSPQEIQYEEDGPITETQKGLIDMQFRRANINGAAYLAACNKGKPMTLEQLSSKKAEKICENLGELMRDQSRIVDSIKGYDSNWRN